jgi:hypothetical protein
MHTASFAAVIDARTFLLLPFDPLSPFFFELGSVLGSPLRLEDSVSFVGTPMEYNVKLSSLHRLAEITFKS